MRIFFGIAIENDLLTSAKLFVRDLKHIPAMKKIHWVPSPNWHLTLRFIGSANEVQVKQLCDLTDPIAKKIPVFQIESNGVLFLSPTHPRIFSLSIHINDSLAKIVHELNEACATCGFSPDERVFLPHVTLGRWRNALHSAPKIEYSDTAQQNVTAFHLYNSEPTEGGSVYTPVKTFHLAGAR